MSLIPNPLRWEPREVLELTRWSRPDDPSWRPGSPGLPGHLQRAFACAVLLRWPNGPNSNGGDFENNLAPLICINKIDLATNRAECEAFMQPYEALGIPVLYTSTRTREGIDELRAALSGQSTVLAGMSGVGKSSLLTTVQPGFDLKVSAVGEYRGEGRHTTTQATLLPLGDGYVIDTPGIREFGLNGVTTKDLIRFYPDLAAYAPGCRFRDCVHLDEVNCRVRAAVDAGEVPAIRYETYSKIARSLRS